MVHFSSIHPAKSNVNLVSSYKPFENELDFTGITFPVSFCNIPKFEKLNNISVSVIYFEEIGKADQFDIIYRTEVKQKVHADLLLLVGDSTSHYCLISSLKRLLNSSKVC